MALVQWEIDSDDDCVYQEGDGPENYSPEVRAVKHAKNIREEYFLEDWTFTVKLDCGSVYKVDLELDTCVKVK